jgi:hypothetical protein
MKREFLYLVKVLCALVTVFMVGSCSTTTRMYSGPELPANQTALIRGADISINLVSCDGKKLSSSNVIVLPGEHTIEMSYYDSVAYRYSSDSSLMDFTAEAGHVYVVDKISGGGRYLSFILDSSTGKKVDRNGRSAQTLSQQLILRDRFVEQAPRYPGSWVERGDLFVAMKRYKDALADYEKALSLTEDALWAKDREAILKRINNTKSLISQ